MKPFLKATLQKFRLLPVLIVVAGFGLVVRLGDTYQGFKSLSGSAYAEETAPTEKPVEDKTAENNAVQEPPAEDLKSKDDPAASPDSKDQADATGDEKKVDLPTTETSDTKWQDASETDLDNSEIKKEVYEDFTKRREDLDGKEKKLAEREALLEAAQKELDKKVKEMEGLRDELKDLLKQQTAEEAARIQSLVKIYSGMKPKDAARIFNTLDTDILMDVISHMPESKAGGIIALMDADRAKALTTLLAEQKKLPDMP